MILELVFWENKFFYYFSLPITIAALLILITGVTYYTRINKEIIWKQIWSGLAFVTSACVFILIAASKNIIWGNPRVAGGKGRFIGDEIYYTLDWQLVWTMLSEIIVFGIVSLAILKKNKI